MNKLFHAVMEVIYWIMIFLSPVFLCALIGLIIVISFDTDISVLYVCLAVGSIVGIIVAEKIRRKYGCVSFWSRILATPDLWPVEGEKERDKEKNKDQGMDNTEG